LPGGRAGLLLWKTFSEMIWETADTPISAPFSPIGARPPARPSPPSSPETPETLYAPFSVCPLNIHNDRAGNNRAGPLACIATRREARVLSLPRFRQQPPGGIGPRTEIAPAVSERIEMQIPHDRDRRVIAVNFYLAPSRLDE